ncbi:MAG: neutral/alkaline non-lysosomal ceramidase N-terminal domain-containing protein [Bryobacteraceae bacterium]|nr:neutral/alkaline non-lysosomal ceramidase N-terminal domain-containing protein [Bryobacteraceae bacterium]MDW8378715.1 neutral/alkaline non-lysosomal ceramidase N-terminal domain-containing protein [Bryobacterales bacterium]
MRPLLVVLLCGTWLRADIVEQGPRNSRPSGLLAGVARADITPPVGIPHLNWGSQTHVEAIGVDPAGMMVTALVVSDGKQTFAMVDVDTLLVGGWEDMVEQAAAASGIPAAHIRLGATHTHAGPMFQREKGPLGVDPAPYEKMMAAYRNQVARAIISTVTQAKQKLQPVHAWAARGVGTINMNRRVRATSQGPAAVGLNPEGFVDRELVVLRVDDANGNPYAVVVNFQCHGTVLTYENKHISPDWIGMMRKTVEQALPGATCLFFQGAAGDQGPVEGGTGDLSVAHRLGRILGLQAAALAMQIETVDRAPQFEGFVESTAFAAKQPWRVRGPRDATLRFVRKTVELPPRQYTEAEIRDMEQKVLAAEKQLTPARQSGDPWRKHQAEARHRRFADLLAKWKRPYDPTPIKVDVQILRIGELAIVAMPGEPFAEIGVAVKKASPFAFTMFCGYSSGQGGDYLPVESEYAHGGYEVERTPYGKGAAEKLIREIQGLFAQLR